MNKPLEVVPYDANWPHAFAAERVRIAAFLGALALRIDPNGSTAVPGLAAKPIIDIQISVERLHPIEEYASKLASLGYLHVPHSDDSFAPSSIGRRSGRIVTMSMLFEGSASWDGARPPRPW